MAPYGCGTCPRQLDRKNRRGTVEVQGPLISSERASREIETIYNRISREKYLDMGYLKVLVLGRELLEQKK